MPHADGLEPCRALGGARTKTAGWRPAVVGGVPQGWGRLRPDLLPQGGRVGHGLDGL